jgi:hypothetical protein
MQEAALTVGSADLDVGTRQDVLACGEDFSVVALELGKAAAKLAKTLNIALRERINAARTSPVP